MPTSRNYSTWGLMTESDSISKLKEYFHKAGYIDSSELVADIGSIPDRVCVMHNSYSLVVIYQPLLEECTTEYSLMKVQEKMHAFIRGVLLTLENQKGLIVDGYLIIALNQEPNAQAEEAVRKIELDTKVCRKHIVWPAGDEGGLARLQFITILSLPELLYSNSENARPFELSTEAKELLSMYVELGSLDRLLDAIKSGELANAN
jgi:hypothetical protein